MLLAAQAARAERRLEEALALARQARAAAPGEPGPAFLLCCLLLERKDPAANDMLDVLNASPDFAAGWEDLGRTLLPQHEAAGRAALRRAAEAYAGMEADAPEVAYRLGAVLRLLGDLGPARAALERATDRDLAAAGAWFGLGLVCQDLRDMPAAVRAFRAALAARPGFHEAAFNLGVTLQESREMEAAMDAYAAAWRARPASFGRIAQALVSADSGRLWLRPSDLRKALSARA